MYYIYILYCADKTLYTGITTNLERRLKEHNNSSKGAKYTRSRRPVEIIFSREHPDRSSASKHEYKIKKMTKSEKLKLVHSEL
jgi:putative endonuclease